MNPENDTKWQALLALSAPTFSGDTAPPYGFVTKTLAKLRAERRECELIERIGWRAFLTSFALLIVTVCFSFDLPLLQHGDLEPGLKGFIQVQSVPIS